MNVNEAFPSKFLKASDIGDAQPVVIIKDVVMETIGEDRRPILYFAGKEKGVVLNKTNATNISEAYGPDTDEWTGKKVILFTAWVDFQGKSVEAIRIRPHRDAKPTVAPAFEEQGGGGRPFAPTDDSDIPFAAEWRG
jgi:hypothetical protein